MFNTSQFTLKILAAVVWYVGIAVLFFKSSSLLIEADKIGASSTLLAMAVTSGLLIGSIKARFLFIRACNKNLQRIDSLKKPKLWNFYRIPFFLFMGLMISLGSYFFKLVQGEVSNMIILAVVELSVGSALLFSSHCFWKK